MLIYSLPNIERYNSHLNYLGSGQNEEVAKALSNLEELTNLVKH